MSRLAYEAVCDERDRLRAQNDQLVEHTTRMDRVDRGLYETPRKPKSDLEPPPKALLDYIAGFDSPAIRKEMRREVLRRHARGEAWDAIVADVMPPAEQLVHSTTEEP